MNYRQSEQHLINEFLKSLEELPDVHAKLCVEEPGKAGARNEVDAQFDLKVDGKSFNLLIEIKKAVYPRDAQQAIWQLRKVGQAQNSDKNSILVLITEFLSPGAKQILQAERIGYYDLGGSIYLPAQGAYVYVDKPPAKPFERSVRDFFSGRRAQVLHTLLIHNQTWFGVHELAGLALVSPSTVSEVFSQLERMDWVSTRGLGPQKERQLCEPTAVLNAWVKQMEITPVPPMTRYYVPGLKTDGLLARIGDQFDRNNIKYALSYEAAAQLYAPFLSSIAQVRVRILETPESQATLSELGARPVTEGANLAIIDAKSEGELLFRNQINNIWLASPIQVYLDLQRGEGRSLEMSEHLRKERIGF